MTTLTKPLAFTITRTLDAPRELVFACWTEDAHLARWQGAPKGMTAHVEVKDIRTGGSYRICLSEANGTEHWVEGRYMEVLR
ncbi:MAG TPA: SRPBCC domain-containing protein, partial [Flavobacteriales bacterium]|nr:SRPBCC domain-containing protein [Flavobacteriales bacterium]